MGSDNNRTSIIRSHTNSYSKNHNPRSGAFLESVIGNNADWDNGKDDGELYEPKPIEPYVNNEIERIVESIKLKTDLIF